MVTKSKSTIAGDLLWVRAMPVQLPSQVSEGEFLKRLKESEDDRPKN